MRYLTIDGMLSGTGIRDSVNGGYLDATDLGISFALTEKLGHWLSRYEHGVLEMRVLSFKHETLNRAITTIVEALAEETNTDLVQKP